MTRTNVWPLVVLSVVGCAGTTPVDTASCSSGQLWTGGSEGGEVDLAKEEDGSATMNPGEACIACHATGEGPTFTVAGTVMGALGDIDDCVGVEGVTVTLTDANGDVTTLTSNGTGNFFTSDPIVMPYTVTLSADGRTTAMSAAQSDGDCASCHTEAGENAAPGRVVAP